VLSISEVVDGGSFIKAFRAKLSQIDVVVKFRHNSGVGGGFFNLSRDDFLKMELQSRALQHFFWSRCDHEFYKNCAVVEHHILNHVERDEKLWVEAFGADFHKFPVKGRKHYLPTGDYKVLQHDFFTATGFFLIDLQGFKKGNQILFTDVTFLQTFDEDDSAKEHIYREILNHQAHDVPLDFRGWLSTMHEHSLKFLQQCAGLSEDEVAKLDLVRIFNLRPYFRETFVTADRS
jgi:hypothetical protein